VRGAFFLFVLVPGRAVGGATGSFRVQYDGPPWAGSGLDGVRWLGWLVPAHWWMDG